MTGWLRDARRARARLPGDVLPQPARRRRSERRAALHRSSCCSRTRRSRIRRSGSASSRPARRARRLRCSRARPTERSTCASTTGRSCSERDAYRRAHRGARTFALDLAFARDAPVLLQGDAGVSRKGPDAAHASFYYSQPQLAVSGSASIGERTRAVSGVAWLDHEWSSRIPGARVPSAGTGPASISTTAAR